MAILNQLKILIFQKPKIHLEILGHEKFRLIKIYYYGKEKECWWLMMKPFAQFFAKRIYGALKVECILVSNGKEALEAYQKSPNFTHILMDIYMPVMDGYDSTKQIRFHEKSQGLPRCKILGISVDIGHETKEACISVGMDDLLTKPLQKELLSQYL